MFACAAKTKHRFSMIDPTGPTIRELLSYRLHRVANLLSRGAEMRYRREFGVSLWEWRSVALLGGAAGPQSLNELARAAGMDKGQMSRVVSGLTRRKIVFREADASDGRGIRLSLTQPGKKLYRKLIAAAAERNSAFLGCLSARERECLEQAMTKLAREAKSFIQKERGR
jgi:DNA-binding MarR family transcriptional regulator